MRIRIPILPLFLGMLLVPVGGAAQPPTGNRPEPGEARPTQTVELTGLDVRGRAASPQLLHFLRRSREATAARRLPKRSFLGNLRRTRRDASLR